MERDSKSLIKEIEILREKGDKVSEKIIQLAKDEDYFELERVLRAETTMMWLREKANARLKQYLHDCKEEIKFLEKPYEILDEMTLGITEKLHTIRKNFRGRIEFLKKEIKSAKDCLK